MADRLEDLNALRVEIDRIDDQLHDLLMERVAIVEKVRSTKAPGATVLRPGREARILKRLAARHQGPFPLEVIIRMWREMMSGTTMLQGPFAVSVFAPERDRQLWTAARDHFGSTTPMTAVSHPVQAIRAVGDGSATIGVVPWPESDDADPWWRALIGTDPKTPRVVARLPFVTPAAADDFVALAVGVQQPEPTGDDHSLLALELVEPQSRSRIRDLMTEVGLDVVGFWGFPSAHDQPAHYLLEVTTFLEPDDQRIAGLQERFGDAALRILSIGSFARPIHLG